MKVEFDTRYLEIVGGDIKAAMMLAVGVAKQHEFNEIHEADQFGHNFWNISIEEWKKLGFGTDKPQKNIRNLLKQNEFWKERKWGKDCITNRACPAEVQYFVDLKILDDELSNSKDINFDF